MNTCNLIFLNLLLLQFTFSHISQQNSDLQRKSQLQTLFELLFQNFHVDLVILPNKTSTPISHSYSEIPKALIPHDLVRSIGQSHKRINCLLRCSKIIRRQNLWKIIKYSNGLVQVYVIPAESDFHDTLSFLSSKIMFHQMQVGEWPNYFIFDSIVQSQYQQELDITITFY